MKTIPNYPKQDHYKMHEKRYVLHPVSKFDEQAQKLFWRAAEVDHAGYIDPFAEDSGKIDFADKGQCQQACDTHNKFHGWSKEEADDIISQSMFNSGAMRIVLPTKKGETNG
jgi:hypothetical protein